MKLRHLQAIQAVISAGTVTGAARLMHITQPAVSKLISQMEAELGLDLFHRERGRVRVTAEGEMFLANARPILEGMEHLSALARDIGAMRIGALRIAAMPALGYGLLPQTVKRFLDASPGVGLVVDVLDREELEQGLATGRYDLGFATHPFSHQAVEAEPLFSVNAVCVAPHGHRFERMKSVPAREFEGEAFVSAAPATLMRFRLDDLFGRLKVRRKLICESRTTTLVCHLVSQGVGVSIVHPLIAAGFGERIVVRPLAQVFRFDYVVLYPTAKPRPRLAVKFVELARVAGRRIGANSG